MNKFDQLVKDFEELLKANPEGLKMLNEVLAQVGDLESRISALEVDLNRRSWDGYVDRQSGAFDATEIAEFHRRDWR
jgi:hypothetical protein